MESLLFVVMLVVPASAALVTGTIGRRRPRWALDVASAAAVVTAACALALVVPVLAAGTDPSLAGEGRTWLRADALTGVILPVVALVATTVLWFARRNLNGDPAAWRFAAGATSLLAATVLVFTAARLDILAAGWVLGSAATVALCGYRGDPGARTARRRTALAVGMGDLGLVLAVLFLVASGVDMDLAGLSANAVEATAGWRGPAVALLLVLAALARAGQLPLPRWLPSTVAAPTPVSALLHAGAVNAGAVLLIRASPLVVPHRVAMTTLAVASGATVVVAWLAMRSRPDAKGALAESTGAQMGFMLLAVAVGAPVAALAHLAGHSMYKSARFLGAGGAISRRAATRRWAPASTGGAAGPFAAGAFAGVASFVAWWWVSAAMEPAERWIVGLAILATAASAVTMVASQPRSVAVPLAARAVAAICGAVLVATAAHRLLDEAVPHTGAFAPLAPSLAALGVAAAAISPLTRHARLGPFLLGAVAPCSVPRRRRPMVPSTPRRAQLAVHLEAA